MQAGCGGGRERLSPIILPELESGKLRDREQAENFKFKWESLTLFTVLLLELVSARSNLVSGMEERASELRDRVLLLFWEIGEFGNVLLLHPNPSS